VPSHVTVNIIHSFVFENNRLRLS